MDNIEFNEPKVKPEERFYFSQVGKPGKITKWLVANSGGRIQNEDQANLVMLIGALVIFGVALYLFFNVGV